ncbi:odorant receptor 131-2-like [Salvelinus fontinalis]|uniref:odorant receptor 131-2-like n=1 Tax=Salvelinus fontinalis TaxID=8038 RepID=UPI002485F789|nr:odorant receptor 131-2-like [Salvelinus fontinalis]
MYNTTGATIQRLYGMPVKAVLNMTPCLLFLYVNGVMLFTLMSKPVFQETTRYILFGHLLFSDSLHLTMSMVMYMLAVTRLTMISYVCMVISCSAGIIAIISPFNLAVMSLERYVAICFPLRHTQIATCRRTHVAIAVMWVLGSLNSLIEVFVFVTIESTPFTLQIFCSTLPGGAIYIELNIAFTTLNFVTVGVIIIYTYIAILVTARSVSSDKTSASKAHKTVLLHLIQLGLCLSSTLFNTINTLIRWHMDPVVGLHIQYVLFLGLIIFPRFLSPLIYGLRDPTFKHIFKYYFTFCFGNSVKPVVIVS